MCHSRPLEAWKVRTSTPPIDPSSNGFVVATQARNPAPSPRGESRRNSSTAWATRRSSSCSGSTTRRCARDRGRFEVSSSRLGASSVSCAHARSCDADPSAATWRITACIGDPAADSLRRTGMPALVSAATIGAVWAFVRTSTATSPVRTSVGSPAPMSEAMAAASASSSAGSISLTAGPSGRLDTSSAG